MASCWPETLNKDLALIMPGLARSYAFDFNLFQTQQGHSPHERCDECFYVSNTIAGMI